MKKRAINYLTFFFCISLTVFLNSCHERGCTDKNAINYNSVADDDDGSCITCKNVIDTISTSSIDVEDNNSSSIHSFQYVATVFVYQIKNNYTYSECGTSSCYFIIKIRNNVPQVMNINYFVEINSNVFFSRNESSNVPGGAAIICDSVPSANLSNPCGIVSTGSLFVTLNNNITYH